MGGCFFLVSVFNNGHKQRQVKCSTFSLWCFTGTKMKWDRRIKRGNFKNFNNKGFCSLSCLNQWVRNIPVRTGFYNRLINYHEVNVLPSANLDSCTDFWICSQHKNVLKPLLNLSYTLTANVASLCIRKQSRVTLDHHFSCFQQQTFWNHFSWCTENKFFYPTHYWFWVWPFFFFQTDFNMLSIIFRF